VADTQIASLKKVAVPSEYTLPLSAEFILKCVNADFDGSGAGGDWLPCVTIVSDSGHVIARAVDQGVKVTAGDDAEVSWFPRLRRRAVALEGPRCLLLGSANGTDTNTITLTKAVPADGVLQVVYCQSTIGDAGDTTSEPSSASDSNAVPGWVISTTLDPLIGLSRENNTGSGPPTTSQVGSAARPCTTGDLGIGSTITVTWSTLDPGLFHTSALVIWQRAFFEVIKQGGFRIYGNNNTHPTVSGSLTTLSWDADYGPGTTNPDRDALVITAMGAYPAVSGFSPYIGAKIGEIASGSNSVAAACYGAKVGVSFDPGGTWPAGAIQLIGNYQTVYPRTFS